MAENVKTAKTSYWKGLKAEFKKIIWPSKESVFKQSVAVTIIAVVLGGLITVFDFLIQYGVNFITQ